MMNIKELKKEAANNYAFWYYQFNSKIVIQNQVRNREFALLLSKDEPNENKEFYSLRNIKVTKLNNIDYVLNVNDMMRKGALFSLYKSVAYYDGGIPFIKTLEERKEWNSKNHNHIKGYDFVIDIDADDVSEIPLALESVKMIVDLYDKMELPYTIVFSGMGFHITIPYIFQTHEVTEDYFHPFNENGIYAKFQKIANKLYNEYTEMIDLNIYDHRRLIKVPFSLAFYEDGCFVAYPINTKPDLNNFDREKYKFHHIYQFALQQNKIRIWNNPKDRGGEKVDFPNCLLD